MKKIILVAEALAPMHPAHTHDEYEVGLCISGQCHFYSCGNVYELKPGVAYIVPPMTEHSHIAVEGTGYKSIIIRFDDRNPRVKNHAVSIIDDRNGALRTMFDLVENLWIDDKDLNERIMNYQLDAIYYYIRGVEAPNLLSTSVSMLRARIENEFPNHRFKAHTAIEELGYNPDYVRRLFKSEIGLSPSDYLTEVRMDFAKTLLKSGKGMTVAQIAYACGYEDANYFTRAFREYTGAVPSNFRRSKADKEERTQE